MATPECGCPLGGLTRNITIWECSACGHAQRASVRRCRGVLPSGEPCRRPKPANPLGVGCCGSTWHAGRPCGECGGLSEDVMPCSDLHPELTHLAPNVKRGNFLDRRGIRRCVGCLAPE